MRTFLAPFYLLFGPEEWSKGDKHSCRSLWAVRQKRTSSLPTSKHESSMPQGLCSVKPKISTWLQKIAWKPYVWDITEALQWFLTTRDAVSLLRGRSWSRSIAKCSFLLYSSERLTKTVGNHWAVSVGNLKNSKHLWTESIWRWFEFQNQLLSEVTK